jgi:integrase/recombinase XerD
MRSRHYAPTTITPRLSVARRWIRTHPDLAAPTHHDVEQWLMKRGLAPSSTRATLVCLRAFYRWALREGLTDRDPTTLVDRPHVPARLPRPAPDREIARLVATGDVQLRALIALMACAGLRCIECSRLDWRDVDLAAGTVIVMGKGMQERLISMSPDTVRALAELRLAAAPDHDAVFIGGSGRRMRTWRISQLVNQAFRALGYTTTAHQLRHRCATAALALPGVDIMQVRDLLGHASVSTTQIYAALAPGRTAATSRRLSLPTEHEATAPPAPGRPRRSMIRLQRRSTSSPQPKAEPHTSGKAQSSS